MTQQAVGQQAETPLISPTDDSESDLWDAAFPDEGDEAGTGDSGGEEPQQLGASEEDEDGGSEPEAEDSEEQPAAQSAQEAEQRRLGWAVAVARDPNAISQVPRRQRKAVMTAVKMANGIVPALAQEQAVWLAEQRFQYMMSLAAKSDELDIIAEDDPTRLTRILGGAEPESFSEDAITQWRAVQGWRQNGNQAPPQRQANQPPQQPAVDPQAVRWANRATAELDAFGEEYGDQAVNDVRVWLEEEGLMTVRTGQEAETGFRTLKAHLDGLRGKTDGGTPSAVQRRRALPKPDVSPGHVDVSGRASKEEMNRRSFGPGATETDAWDAV